VRVVVDTHALVWFLSGSALLTDDARRALRDAQDSDGIIVSTALLADLCYVTQTTEAFSTRDLDAVQEVVADEFTAIDLAPIDLGVFDEWRRLDRMVLADPWDRFIVATAITKGIPLVTRDEAISGSKLRVRRHTSNQPAQAPDERLVRPPRAPGASRAPDGLKDKRQD
jgi:PIN domain nuclease of toxin-antitoxin system